MRTTKHGRSPRSAAALRLALVMLVTVTILASCSRPPEHAGSESSSIIVGTTVPLIELTERDLAYIATYREILKGAGAVVWPGWGDTVPPILQRGEESEYLVGHPDPPAGFRPTGLEIEGAAIWSSPAGTVTPGLYAAPWNVAGTWGPMIPLRPVFEKAVEEMLGDGGVVWDDAAYLRAILHEGFHSFQFEANPAFPAFGSEPADDGAVAEALLHVADLESQYAQEARLLHRAIEAPDLAAVRDFAGRFLELRTSRRALLPGVVAAHERTMEWVEGVARYADVNLLALADEFGASLNHVDIPDEATVLDSYLDDLAADATRPDGLAGWWQALGSAQGFVLDRLSMGWQDQLLLEGRSLEDLLAEAVEVPPSLNALPIARVRVGNVALLVAVARTPQEWATGLGDIESIGPLDGMLFWFPQDVTGAGFTMEGALRPLDVVFFAADGAPLGTLSMPPCIAHPCATYGPDTAFRYAIEIESNSLLADSDASLVLPRLPQRPMTAIDHDERTSDDR